MKINKKVNNIKIKKKIENFLIRLICDWAALKFKFLNFY